MRSPGSACNTEEEDNVTDEEALVTARPAAPAEAAAEDTQARVATAPASGVDPARIRLWRGPSGELRVEIAGDRCVLRAKAVRAFPLTIPERYVSILDGEHREVCLIEDPAALEPESQAMLVEALRDYYRIHRILRIRSLRSEYRTTYWDVETERGVRDFVVKWGKETVLRPHEHAFIFIDIDGNRFSIADRRALDPQSRKFLQELEE